MLVLTRRRSESIRIGNDVVIKVIQTGRGMVRLGIEAPAHVRVLRAELTEFSDAPEVVSAVKANSHGIETNGGGASALQTEDDPSIDFTTEYAMEVENQIACASGSLIWFIRRHGRT